MPLLSYWFLAKYLTPNIIIITYTNKKVKAVMKESIGREGARIRPLPVRLQVCRVLALQKDESVFLSIPFPVPGLAWIDIVL